ncbi:hypothetical protein [Empedobacter stercoris]|uniref:hypothetical protein n=1 Tax=Empedobacter stercoris TaxID=1628248 RepID=UPI0039E8D8F1
MKDKNLVFNIFIVLLFLLPNNSIFYLINILMLFFLIKSNILNVLVNQNFKFLLIFVGIFSFLFNINSIGIDFKDLMIFVNIILLIILFPYFNHHNNNYNIKPQTLYFIYFVILFSQLSFMLNIPIINNVIKSIYWNNESDKDFDFFVGIGRNGGLFFNPNQASKYLTLLLVLVIYLKNKYKYFIVLLIILSILLTGSRTGFIITSIILSIHVFYELKNIKIGFLALLTAMYIILFKLPDDNRSLKVNETGSFDYKVNVLVDYINKITYNDEFKSLLFGNFSSNHEYISNKFHLDKKYIFGFDAEIGYIISFFGLIFFTILITYFIKIFCSKNIRNNILIIVPFTFWILTSTILFSFKTSILYMVVLGYLFSKNKQNNATKNIQLQRR